MINITCSVRLCETLAQQMNRKNSFVVTRRVFEAQNDQPMRLRLGLRPRPRWGSLQWSSRLPSWINGPYTTSKGGEGKEERMGKERRGGGKSEGECLASAAGGTLARRLLASRTTPTVTDIARSSV